MGGGGGGGTTIQEKVTNTEADINPFHSLQDSMSPLYRKIIPALLRLACDVDKVTNQLYSALVTQLIHWFTNPAKYGSPETGVLLDCIMTGVAHPTDRCGTSFFFFLFQFGTYFLFVFSGGKFGTFFSFMRFWGV